jgi:SAM-dependent methyltransferase
MFYTLRPIRRLQRRDRHRIITTWARGANPTLHVGCGSGIVTQSLNNGIGLDLNFGKLRFLKRHGVAVVCASPQALPFRAYTFACLVGSPTIQPGHVTSLSEMHRVLRPGGTLIFSTPKRSAKGLENQRSSSGLSEAGGTTSALAENGFVIDEGPIIAHDELLVRCRKSEGK